MVNYATLEIRGEEMEYVVYTNRGKIREDNEDSYLVKTRPFPLFAVADGMGGHQAGEVASQLAVKFLDSYTFDTGNLSIAIEEAINKANEEILQLGVNKASYQGMGTTLSMGIILNNKLFIGHVGDSRIYIYRDGELKQLTTDHSLVNELLENKQITSQEAFNHPQKNIITQALGISQNLNVEIKEIDLLKGDLLLFSTDGLHDLLCYQEINEFLATGKEIESISNLMGEEALHKGGNDNITFIIVKLD